MTCAERLTLVLPQNPQHLLRVFCCLPFVLVFDRFISARRPLDHGLTQRSGPAGGPVLTQNQVLHPG